MVRAEDPQKLPQPTSYVSDFAGVIDASSQQQIEALSREVYEQAHATIQVVTIRSLDGLTIEDFTTQLEDKWKVGPKASDKGILMIFAIQDHKRRIEVGYGLEGILNDAKVGDIGRSMVPQLRDDDYGAAILTGEQQIANVIAADAGVTLTPIAPAQTYHRESTYRHSGFPIGRLILFLFILLVVFRGGGRGGGWFWFLLGNMMGGGGGGRWRDGDGGGFGGGGGGGGGGDFGGGFGGSSGGGGASGDW